MTTERYSDRIPYLFGKNTELAQLPPDTRNIIQYDLLYDGITLEEAIEDHWGAGLLDEDPFDPSAIEEQEPDALEKAMYQAGIRDATGNSPVMTPYGPALADEEVDAMLNAYPGATSIMGDLDAYTEGWEGTFGDVEQVISASGSTFDDLVEAGDDFAFTTGTLDRLDETYNQIGANLGQQVQSLQIPGALMTAGPVWNFEDVISAVSEGARNVGNFVKRQIESRGERMAIGADPFGQLGMSDPARMVDDELYRSYLDEWQSQGSQPFVENMQSAVEGGSGSTDSFVDFANRAVANGEMSEAAARDIFAEAHTISANMSFVPGRADSLVAEDFETGPPGGAPVPAQTDYEVTQSGTAADPVDYAYVGLGENLAPDPIGDFTGIGMDAVAEDFEMAEPDDEAEPDAEPDDETEPDEVTLEEWVDELSDEAKSYFDSRIQAGISASEARKETQSGIDLGVFGLTKTEDPMLGDNGPLGEQELEKEFYPDFPQGEDRVGERSRSWMDESVDRQTRIDRFYGATSPEAQYFRLHQKLPGEDLAPERLGITGDDYETVFTRRWNLQPGSDSWTARQVYPLAYDDIDTLYHLQRPFTYADGTEPYDEGKIGAVKFDPFADDKNYFQQEAIEENEVETFNDFTNQYFADPNMRSSNQLYENIRSMRDRQMRFAGMPVSIDADQAFKEQQPYELSTLDDPRDEFTFDAIKHLPGEDPVSTIWQRWNFMDQTNTKAMARLANAVTLYNMNPGADRWEQARMKKMMTQTLSDWLASGKSPEAYLTTFVQDRPGRMADPSTSGAWGNPGW